jgi:predicted esterase
MGMQMPGWFDIVSLARRLPPPPGLCKTKVNGVHDRQKSFADISMAEDEEGIMKSVRLVHSIIDEQIDKGIASERIVVGGFSQGGAISLLASMSTTRSPSRD